jgi:hypothetical protein
MAVDRSRCRPTRAEALEQLPPAYSLALRLRVAGLAEGLIAECLGVEPEALGPLFEVAEAKLSALRDEPRPGGEEASRHPDRG